jgi:hypothetical protein
MESERPSQASQPWPERDRTLEGEVGSSEAAAALASIGRSRSWLADRAIAPWWYHPAFGALNGALLAVGAARNSMLLTWSVVAYTFACGALMWWNQRRVGVWIRHHQGWENVAFIGQVSALAGLVALACWLGLARGLTAAFPAAGAAALLVTVAFGKVTDVVLRARLEGRM